MSPGCPTGLLEYHRPRERLPRPCPPFFSQSSPSALGVTPEALSVSCDLAPPSSRPWLIGLRMPPWFKQANQMVCLGIVGRLVSWLGLVPDLRPGKLTDCKAAAFTFTVVCTIGKKQKVMYRRRKERSSDDEICGEEERNCLCFSWWPRLLFLPDIQT